MIRIGRFLPPLLIAAALLVPNGAGAIPVETFEVPPGVSLLVSRQRHIPVVYMVMVFPGGALAEPAGKGGLATVTAELLQRGTRAHSSREFATALDAIGAELSVGADNDMLTVTLSSLTDRLDETLDLLAELLAFPAFDPATFEKVRSQALAALKAAEEGPGFLARRSMLKALYNSHPYGRPLTGTAASLATLTVADCRAYWKRVSGPAGAIITAAGDVEGSDLAKRIRKRLAPWLAGSGKVFKEIPPLPPPGKPAFAKIDGPFTQTTVLLGQRGIARTDPSYYAFQLFNYSLGGGGFSSRLLDEIRDNRGLVYAVYSRFDAGLLPGPFQIMLQTKNASAREALALVRKEVRKALAEGISEKEIEDAKGYLIGTYPRRYDTNAKIARFLAATAFHGLGTDYDRVYPEKIRAITRAEVNKAARDLLDPPRFDIVAVGNLDEAGFSDR